MSLNRHVVSLPGGKVGIVTLSEGGDQSLKLQQTVAELRKQHGSCEYCGAVDATTLLPRDQYRDAWTWNGHRIVIDQVRKAAIDAQSATPSMEARVTALEARLNSRQIP